MTDTPPASEAGTDPPDVQDVTEDTIEMSMESEVLVTVNTETRNDIPKVSTATRSFNIWKSSAMKTAEVGVKVQLQKISEQRSKRKRSNSIAGVTDLMIRRWRSSRQLLICEPKTCYLDSRKVGSNLDLPSSTYYI